MPAAKNNLDDLFNMELLQKNYWLNKKLTVILRPAYVDDLIMYLIDGILLNLVESCDNSAV